MTQNKFLGEEVKLNPKCEVNRVMEQNPSKKTKLMSVKRADVKLF